MMKKIIIVNNNMKVGGVQKSLCNLLWELHKEKTYDVTLVLFSAVGDYIDQLPPDIKCIYTTSLFRYMGVSQGEMLGIDKIKRGTLAAICRIFGRKYAIAAMRLSQHTLPDEYDVAIAFLHNGRNKTFFGGVQDFVLHCIKAKKKITFLHDDYNKCGANHKHNNKLMAKFDLIASCSDGCRRVFENALPELAHKSVTVRNCNNIEAIRSMADEDAVIYNNEQLNIVCAVRLTPRKGVDRAINAISYVLNKGLPVCLHILGSGVAEEELKQMVNAYKLEQNVIFYGEQKNPYRFIKNADIFMLTSFHEAAPMVIDESYILGVPVLATRTNSSEEMIIQRGCGWVCENSQEALNEKLLEVASDRDMIVEIKERLKNRTLNNEQAIKQFDSVLN